MRKSWWRLTVVRMEGVFYVLLLLLPLATLHSHRDMLPNGQSEEETLNLLRAMKRRVSKQLDLQVEAAFKSVHSPSFSSPPSDDNNVNNRVINDKIKNGLNNDNTKSGDLNNNAGSRSNKNDVKSDYDFRDIGMTSVRAVKRRQKTCRGWRDPCVPWTDQEDRMCCAPRHMVCRCNLWGQNCRCVSRGWGK